MLRDPLGTDHQKLRLTARHTARQNCADPNRFANFLNKGQLFCGNIQARSTAESGRL